MLTATLLALLASFLLHDFQRDKGQHRRAKLLHAAFLGLVVLSYASAFGLATQLVINHDAMYQRFGRPVGVVAGPVHFALVIGHAGLSVWLLLLAGQLARRQPQARQQLRYLLPLLALSESFSFYRGWVSAPDEVLMLPHSLIWLIGLTFSGAVAAGLLALYRSRRMQRFFAPVVVEAGPAVIPAVAAAEA